MNNNHIGCMTMTDKKAVDNSTNFDYNEYKLNELEVVQ